MSIKIELNPVLRQFINKQDKIEVNGSNVKECLDDLMRQFPDIKKWLFSGSGKLWVLIIINGETVSPQDLDRPVKDGEEIKLILPVGGG